MSEVVLNQKVYLKASAVRARYGHVSNMWLHRHVKAGDFPAPVTFTDKGIRFWDAADLDAYDAARRSA